MSELVEFNTIVQSHRDQPRPQIVWTTLKRAKKQFFRCDLHFLCTSASGLGPTKRESKKKAVRQWKQLRETVAVQSSVTSYTSFMAWIERVRPQCIDMVDGDNVWDMVASLLQCSQALYIVGGRSMTHEAPELRTPGAVCFLERCECVAKNAADMMLAFRAGQMVERLSYRPHIRVLSRDAAFDMVRCLLRDKGHEVRLIARTDQLDPRWLPHLDARRLGGRFKDWTQARHTLLASSVSPSTVASRCGLGVADMAQVLCAAVFALEHRWQGEPLPEKLRGASSLEEMDALWSSVFPSRVPSHSPGEEAVARNQELKRLHGRIPTVALWTGDSVGSPESWQSWWDTAREPP